MPMHYLHVMFGGAFLAVWFFIATMMFRDRLIEIRRDRAANSTRGIHPPHYLKHQEKRRPVQVA
jgi:hypothetical protein